MSNIIEADILALIKIAKNVINELEAIEKGDMANDIREKIKKIEDPKTTKKTRNITAIGLDELLTFIEVKNVIKR